MAFDVSTLTSFTDEVSGELIRKSVLTGRTMDYVTIQPGVKYAAALNILTNTVSVVDATCGFTPAGSVKLSQRDIQVAPMGVYDKLCPKDLESKWAGQLMKPGSDENIPFQDVIAQSYVDGIKEQNEYHIWKGDTDSVGEYNKFDGLLKITVGTGSPNSGSVYVSAASGSHTTSDIVAHVDAMVAAIPEDILEKDDLILFVSYGTYGIYTQALRTANLFHYNGAVGADYTCVIPGTNVKVVATKGLKATGYMLLTSGSNIVVGTDLLNEEEKFDIFWSKDNNEVRVIAEWKLGVQVAFPEFCVVNY